MEETSDHTYNSIKEVNLENDEGIEPLKEFP